MSDQFGPYRKLLKRAKEVSFYSSAVETLNWDLETYMPQRALGFRAEELAHFSGHAHRLITAKSVGESISACEQHGFRPDSDEAANLREWRRRYDRATKIPTRLVEKLERTRAHAREAWKTARQKSEFKPFKPHLQKLIEINRQMADQWGYKESRYEALVEEYEPGIGIAQLRTLLGQLRSGLAQVVGPAVERSKALPADLLEGNYPTAAQQAFNRRVAEAVGFDFAGGRIDTTTHPFCSTLGAGDCRLTTRYNEQNFTQSLYGVLHEAGHGMYEQGLPVERFGTPLGTAVSLGVHESQSRLWENHVGRSPGFWEHWFPTACEHFPELKKFSPAQVSSAVNRVAPSFIRVEADQVTYDLHIILRFEIEMKLIEDQLAVADVPAYWNQEFEKMLSLRVPRDPEGCLQDIHWSLGTFGYFPTYTLGNLNAAQLMARAAADHPALDAELARGQYSTLLGWLRQKVHSQGSRYDSQDLMQRATGSPTAVTAHLETLSRKFTA
jgi:carboxypeptidase Taq